MIVRVRVALASLDRKIVCWWMTFHQPESSHMTFKPLKPLISHGAQVTLTWTIKQFFIANRIFSCLQMNNFTKKIIPIVVYHHIIAVTLNSPKSSQDIWVSSFPPVAILTHVQNWLSVGRYMTVILLCWPRDIVFWAWCYVTDSWFLIDQAGTCVPGSKMTSRSL